MVLRIALSDVLDKGTIVWQKVRCDMDSLRVPNFAVLQTVLLRAQRCQEAQLRPDAEVRDNDIKRLVQELVFANLRHQVVSDALLSRD